MNGTQIKSKPLMRWGILFNFIIFYAGYKIASFMDKSIETIECAVPHNTQDAKKDEKALFVIDGNVSITEAEFTHHVDTIIAMNPQFKHIIETVPSVRYNIFTGMMNEKILKTWVEKSHIAETENYKKDYDLAVGMLEYELARKYFQDEIAQKVHITASEIKTYYDEQKMKNQNFIIEQGHVHAVGAYFDTEQARNLFSETIKGNEKGFIKKAQEHKIAYTDFGNISKNTTGIDESLKQAIISYEDVARSIKVSDKDGKHWCLAIVDVKETEYHPLAKVTESIEQILKSEKITASYTEKLEALKMAYNVQEKKEYFDMSDHVDFLDQKIASVDNKKSELDKKVVTEKVA
ncbi:hypothetical protein K9K77_01990 [Candidatus Babeliales bacterium]|nr:hypothetical protein [Candidatus Babeliales bacterium]